MGLEKELRIGNLVQGEPMEVNNITTDVFQVTGEGIRHIELKTWKPKPIHLTEEWLEKLGFEGCRIAFKLNNCFRTIVLDWADNNEYFVDYHEQIDDEVYTVNLQKIKYVHQLQNLYFCLCGEELKINIPLEKSN
jgi:hypothetical protein